MADPRASLPPGFKIEQGADPMASLPQGFKLEGGEAPNSAVDAIKSIPGGLASAVTGPGDAASFASDTFANLMEKTFPGSGQYVRGFLKLQGKAAPVMPTSDVANAAFHQPETTAGEYAKTISSFAPAALAPGSAMTRAANVAVPGIMSETGGQMTKGTPYEPFARAGGALAGAGVVAAAPTVGRTGARVANSAYNAVTGNELLDPEREAALRMAAALQRDGGAARVNQGLQDWRGKSDPSLLDVAGGNANRLVRAAASGPEGEAQNIAQKYERRVQGNIQDNASALARALTPNEQRPGPVVLEDLNKTRDALAKEQYAGPYRQPATVTPEMVDALQGPAGQRAIREAYATALDRRDIQAAGELKDLLAVASEQSGGRDPLTGRVRSLETALQDLSSGSLDRVRIAMRDIGGAYAAKGRNARAEGYGRRVNDIDTALDQTPGLTEARGTYRNYSNQISAHELGQGATHTPSAEYTGQLEALNDQAPDAARRAAGVGYRQSIVDGIERPAAGSTGFLNRLATSNQQGNNLTATYGPQAAGDFQTGIDNEITKVNNARAINPNTGSQTYLRAEEQALVESVPTTKAGIITKMIGAIRNGGPMTANERAALVRMGITEANLRQLVENMPHRPTPQIANQALLALALSQQDPRQ